MNCNGSVGGISRREFVKASAVTAAAVAMPAASYGFFAQGDDSIKVGVIGCGGRGTGAAIDCIKASPAVKIVALGDVMSDRVDGSRRNLVEHGGKQVQVADDKVFAGFDAYKKVIGSGVDVVILATPPGFRPIHFNEAVNAGKHVFFEKPVAVDAAGVRMVIAAGEIARQKKLTVITGTQRRHEKCYLEAMKRVQDGAIGKVIGARCSWNQGGLWHHAHKPEWSDMEWQLRNWLYFTWLSGDHIVEQHVHNIDVCNWAIGATPTKCYGMGGRQVRTAPEFGQIFDHFAVEYEYPDGQVMFSECRQIDGCDGRVDETILGSEGRLLSRSGSAQIKGKNAWQFDGENGNPYEDEHVDLIKSITTGAAVNEAKRVAESTLTAIMGRMSAYTGKTVTWEQALNSKEDLMPKDLSMGSLPTPPVAVPGKTPLI